MKKLLEKIPEFNLERMMKSNQVKQVSDIPVDPVLDQFTGNERLCNASITDCMSIDENDDLY